MISEDFEIFYYNDYGMQNLRDHFHDYYEFYFFLDGNVKMVINGDSHKLLPGDMILLPPGLKHHVEILDKSLAYQRMVFWISRSFAGSLISTSADYGYVISHCGNENAYICHFEGIDFNIIQSKMLALIEEVHSHRYGSNSMVSLYVNELILTISRIIYESENPLEIQEADTLYESILSYIEEHIDEELSLDTLARKFYSSKYYISHIFKDNLGISVHQYILKKRLALIRDALSANEDINKAILTYGFHDYSSFYRAFKKEYGISPREYKDKLKAIQE